MTAAADPDPSLDHRGAVIWLLVCGGLAAVGAAVLVPWVWVPGGELVPAAPSDLFTAGQIERAEEFATLRRALSWSSYALTIVLAVVLGFTRAGSSLVRRLPGPWWLTVVLAVLGLGLLARLVTLPFALLLRRQSLEYGLTTQGIGDWWLDQGRGFLVDGVVTALVLVVIIGIARWRPRRWFVWAGAAGAALTVAGSFAYPLVVEPVFNRFVSLEEGPFRQSVLALAEREGVQVDDVLVSDASRRTTTLNAYVSGIASSRRIVVYDNLLEELTPDEARTVIAHELAHAKHDDVLVGTGLGALGIAAAMGGLALIVDSRGVRRRAGVSGVTDPASVPLLLAVVAVAMFLASPVENTISRAIEMRADREALAATGDDEVFVRMQQRLALQAIHDPTPPLLSQVWFGSHPTVVERAGLPESLRRADR